MYVSYNSAISPLAIFPHETHTYVPGDMYNYFYTSTVQDGKALGKP